MNQATHTAVKLDSVNFHTGERKKTYCTCINFFSKYTQSEGEKLRGRQTGKQTGKYEERERGKERVQMGR